MNLNFEFSKTMNLNLNFHLSRTMNLNFGFSKTMNLNLKFKNVLISPTLANHNLRRYWYLNYAF